MALNLSSYTQPGPWGLLSEAACQGRWKDGGNDLALCIGALCLLVWLQVDVVQQEVSTFLAAGALEFALVRAVCPMDVGEADVADRRRVRRAEGGHGAGGRAGVSASNDNRVLDVVHRYVLVGNVRNRAPFVSFRRLDAAAVFGSVHDDVAESYVLDNSVSDTAYAGPMPGSEPAIFNQHVRGRPFDSNIVIPTRQGAVSDVNVGSRWVDAVQVLGGLGVRVVDGHLRQQQTRRNKGEIDKYTGKAG